MGQVTSKKIIITMSVFFVNSKIDFEIFFFLNLNFSDTLIFFHVSYYDVARLAHV